MPLRCGVMAAGQAPASDKLVRVGSASTMRCDGCGAGLGHSGESLKPVGCKQRRPCQRQVDAACFMPQKKSSWGLIAPRHCLRRAAAAACSFRRRRTLSCQTCSCAGVSRLSDSGGPAPLLPGPVSSDCATVLDLRGGLPHAAYLYATESGVLNAIRCEAGGGPVSLLLCAFRC